MLTPKTLQQIRKNELGMTLRQLADKTPYSFGYLGQMETGFSPIPKDMVKILKTILKEKAKELKLVVDSM